MATNLLNEKELLSALLKGSSGGTTSAAKTTKSGGKIPLPAGKNALNSQDDKAGEESAYTASSYYTQPELGVDRAKLVKTVLAAKMEMEQAASAYGSVSAKMQDVEEGLALWTQQVQVMQESYHKSPTEAGAEQLNRAREQLQVIMQDFLTVQSDYNDAQAVYQPASQKYSDAVDSYNSYIQEQQSRYDAWKSTIRDQASISRDLEQADSQIAALEERISSLQSLTRFRSDELGQSMKASLAQAQQELETLQAGRALLQEEHDWSRYYQYSDLTQAADFGEKSSYATTANGLEPVLNALRGTYTETGFDDLTYDYINRNEEARNKAMVNSIGDNTALLGLDTSYLEQMSDEEIAIFNYLYATEGADAAYQYTAYLTGDLNSRQRAQQQAQWAQWAEESPVASSVFSTLSRR